jgi:hypothetical protein
MEDILGNWSGTLQDIAKGAVSGFTDYKFRQPFELDKLRIQAYSDNGYYREGAPGLVRPPNGGTGLQITSGMLLLAGAAVLAVVLLKD